MFVDSHCHLNAKELLPDLPNILARAQEAKIDHMLTICTEMEEFDAIHALTLHHPPLSCTVGVHPNHVKKDALISPEILIRHTQKAKVVGVGETGLDYYYDYSDPAAQAQQFRHHITASRQTQLPLVIHMRDAEKDMISILQEELKKGAFPALIHCFSASQNFADAVLDLGLYIAVGGIMTFKNADTLRATLATIPMDRLLLETDSPYLAPVPMRGKINEPKNIPYIAEIVAEVKNLSLDKVAEITTCNFYGLFNKIKKP